MNYRIKVALLVSLQFILLGLLVFTTHNIHISIFAGAFLLTSVLLAAYAIITMQKSKLRISPIPASTAILIIDGPYKWIRHPMYTSVLSGCIGLLLMQFSWVRLLILFALFIDLLIKLRWEEEMLCAKFPEYETYTKQSKRMIPYIF